MFKKVRGFWAEVNGTAKPLFFLPKNWPKKNLTPLSAFDFAGGSGLHLRHPGKGNFHYHPPGSTEASPPGSCGISITPVGKRNFLMLPKSTYEPKNSGAKVSSLSIRNCYLPIFLHSYQNHDFGGSSPTRNAS